LTNGTDLNISRKGLPTDFKLSGEVNVALSEMALNITYWIDVSDVNLDAHNPRNVTKYAHVVLGYGKNVPTKSRIQLSRSFLIVVIVCNAVKLTIMLWALYMEKSDFIVTLGDGAASFLEHHDPTTEKFCVFSKDAVIAEVRHRLSKQDGPQTLSTDTSNVDSQFGSRPKAQAAPEPDQLEEIMLNLHGTWRDQKHLYSSALGKDRQVGSSFM
jgi:hypothetical protein